MHRTTVGGVAEDAPSWVVGIALGIVYIVWGSTYLAIRVAVRTLPPLLHAGVRFIVAGSLMYLWLAFRGGFEGVKVSRRELASAAALGTALLVGGNGVVAIAEREIPSSLAALIIAAVPLWVVVLRFVTGERIRRGTLVGVALGFSGVALLVGPGGPGRVALWGEGLAIVASLSWATGSFLSTRLRPPRDPFLSASLQMLCAGALLVLASVATGEWVDLRPESFSGESLLALAYLIVAGSLVAFTAYTWLLQNVPISKVSTYAYVNPGVAVFLGWLILGERVNVGVLVGAGLIVASVAFIVRQESRRPAPSPEPVAPPQAAPAQTTSRGRSR